MLKLPIKMGGAGVGYSHRRRTAFYVASITECQYAVNEVGGDAVDLLEGELSITSRKVYLFVARTAFSKKSTLPGCPTCFPIRSPRWFVQSNRPSFRKLMVYPALPPLSPSMIVLTMQKLNLDGCVFFSLVSPAVGTLSLKYFSETSENAS